MSLLPFKRGDYILDIAHAHCTTVRQSIYRLVEPSDDHGTSRYWEVTTPGRRNPAVGSVHVVVDAACTIRLTREQVKVILDRR